MTTPSVEQLQAMLRSAKGLYMALARMLEAAGRLSVKEHRALAFLEEEQTTPRDDLTDQVRR